MTTTREWDRDLPLCTESRWRLDQCHLRRRHHTRGRGQGVLCQERLQLVHVISCSPTGSAFPDGMHEPIVATLVEHTHEECCAVEAGVRGKVIAANDSLSCGLVEAAACTMDVVELLATVAVDDEAQVLSVRRELSQVHRDRLVISLLVPLALVASMLDRAISARQVVEENQVHLLQLSVQNNAACVQVDVHSIGHVPRQAKGEHVHDFIRAVGDLHAKPLRQDGLDCRLGYLGHRCSCGGRGGGPPCGRCNVFGGDCDHCRSLGLLARERNSVALFATTGEQLGPSQHCLPEGIIGPRKDPVV
mmetsp:Transcript_27620/g.80680  ORF Transcript_27620/g.80680 Transcript_27620/m.80680 type:complete len:304 (-) Transcript_27620:158-1069(-)